MTHKFLGLSALLLTSLATTANANPGFTFHTDRPSWEVALGAITTETFNSFGQDTDATSVTFAGFSISGSSRDGILVGVPTYGYDTELADIDGTPRLNFAGLFSASLVFDSAISAVGFDTVNYDIDDDSLQLLVNGVVSAGFFPAARNQTGFLESSATMALTSRALLSLVMATPTTPWTTYPLLPYPKFPLAYIPPEVSLSWVLPRLENSAAVAKRPEFLFANRTLFPILRTLPVAFVEPQIIAEHQ